MAGVAAEPTLLVRVSTTRSTDCIDDAPGTLFIIVGMYDKKGMHHARNPKQKREYKVCQRLKWFAAEEDGCGRENYRQYVSHDSTRQLEVGGLVNARVQSHARRNSMSDSSPRLMQHMPHMKPH